MEYEIEAEIVQFAGTSAKIEAYHIIASGDGARTLHYVFNNEECKSGIQLILMDFGANYGGYAADLTRTIPVNGKFTRRQRKIYDTCLHLHNHAKSLLKPGITINKYHEMVADEASAVF